MKRTLWILVALLSVALVGAVFAQSANEGFKAKWKRLTKDPDKVFKVTAKPGEEIPEATLDLSFGPGSLVSVSRGSKGKRDMLEENDIVAVVNRNLRAVKFCYCKALKSDPSSRARPSWACRSRPPGRWARWTSSPRTWPTTSSANASPPGWPNGASPSSPARRKTA